MIHYIDLQYLHVKYAAGQLAVAIQYSAEYCHFTDGPAEVDFGTDMCCSSQGPEAVRGGNLHSALQDSGRAATEVDTQMPHT